MAPSGSIHDLRKLKMKDKIYGLAWKEEGVLWEEIAKLLGRCWSSFNRLVVKIKNLTIPLQTGLRIGQRNR
jgi:hypothetical protein